MHRLATCPGLDPPEDVVLVEQAGADVLFLTSAGTDISCLDACLPINPAWNERIRALPLSCLEHREILAGASPISTAANGG